MKRPRVITEEEYNKRYAKLYKRAQTLAQELRPTHTRDEFMSNALIPCGVRNYALDKLMRKLNSPYKWHFRRGDGDTPFVVHFIERPCSKLHTLHCPETMCECLATHKGVRYYHRHPVGECWFRAYPAPAVLNEILLREAEHDES